MSNLTSVITEICLKNLTSCVLPFKVAKGHQNRHDWLPVRCDLLLTFHSNYDPISYRFDDFSRKSQNFSQPCVFDAPAKGFSWNRVPPDGLRKLGWWNCQAEKKFYIFIALNSIQDWQTNGRTPVDSYSTPLTHSVARIMLQFL